MYQTLVAVHGAIGAVGLLCFWSALSLKKGSGAHRLAGRVYLLAMLGICVTGAPMAISRFVEGKLTGGAFLSYLLLLVLGAGWLGWRAIRDKHDVDRYRGGAYLGIALTWLAAGVAMLLLGLVKGAPLIAGFSLVGLHAGYDMLRRRRTLGENPRWWMRSHYSALFGTGVATHISFLSIGLPRLLPMLDGPMLGYASWFVPLLVSMVATIMLDRKYRVAPVANRAKPLLAST
ncbi:MAG: hypothetical protein ABI650_07000 [Dokdonella sp.]